MLRHALLALSLLAAPATALAGERAFDLMVGDRAPALSVAEWVKGEPVSGFQKGTAYVVEFWATWCGPCRKAIPHVSELQKKYADKGLRVVGVAVWEQDPSLVDPFVEKMGDQMAYAVAKDQAKQGDGGAMSQSWMRASGQQGIPASFIVDREGRIAWIGHPMSLDEPLARVIEGTWDLEKAAADYAREVGARALTAKLQEELQRSIGEERFGDALARLDVALAEHPELERDFGIAKLLCLTHVGPREKVASYGEHLLGSIYAKEAGALGFVARIMIDPESTAPFRDRALALKAAEKANELTEWKQAPFLDVLAQALFQDGQRERAIELLEKALLLAKGTPLEPELGERLARYKSGA